MELGSPASLLSGLIIGLVGCALFLYGKKQSAPRPLVAGALLCVYPYFIASVLAMWVIFATIVTGLYLWSRE